MRKKNHFLRIFFREHSVLFIAGKKFRWKELIKGILDQNERLIHIFIIYYTFLFLMFLSTTHINYNREG